MATKFVAILNVTPDSFSDGGVNFAFRSAIESIADMIESGVDIIDIGAESTRPGCKSLEQGEEIDRLKEILPAAVQLVKNTKTKISLDTRNYDTASFGVDSGIDILNDVSFGRNLGLLRLVAENPQLNYLIMHSIAIPEDRSKLIPFDLDPVKEVITAFKIKLKELEQIGINRNQIIVDPGIGFGKEAAQSWEMLKRIDEFKELGFPLLIGHSRKSFMGELPRDITTNVLTLYLLQKAIDFIRVHDYQNNMIVNKIKEKLS